MTILFTTGINENGSARVRADANGNPRMHVDNTSGVYGRINPEGIPTAQILFFGPNEKQPSIHLPVKPLLIFNQISDADSHKTALERCRIFCQNLKGIPVINHPDAVARTTRDNVAELLQGIPGLTVPRVIRCNPRTPEEVFEAAESAGISLPIIFRSTGQHNAQNMELIKDKSELHKLHAFPLDGQDFYLCEFHDFKDENGIYFTQRIVMIDGKAHLRHALYLDHWKVNSDSKPYMSSHPEMGDPFENAVAIEKERLPKATKIFEEIARRLEMDYFGIDCSINENGEVLLFEANANMIILAEQKGALFETFRIPVKSNVLGMMLARINEVKGEIIR
jgi:hypothetical protein